ncbi:DUF2784 domain-containing protein [Herminiimonas fonticola]|uniref:Uncharacterized protein DUF2784 n=1 Tax=Herminiimonas fonticola TaxID=303380 RepID=A0A4R6G4R9_9BURK|nr:DUF2784 domain-containing protein [Herminiimonas fonticola]RBA23089.1 Protein of Unknown function (DUF2784) [Herminiimonas fonticola]TDN89469.1 uncharacterized protein DUF2784 [Herminiimonas fonticola]
MSNSLPYGFLANVVLALHALIVLFVIGGLLLVILGNLRSWQWVNTLWFRLLHLATILIVVAEAWLGLVCPLTTLEMWFRAQAGTIPYSGDFIEHWLQTILFWDAPSWVFITTYSIFSLAVAATWWYFPPKTKRHWHKPSA